MIYQSCEQKLEMRYLIRKANRNDISQLEKLLGAYMRETYQVVWSGDAARLEKDLFGGTFEMFVAERALQEVIGFVAWIPTYDLHHCLKGGEIIDFYVSPQSRGRGVGLLLAIELAAVVKARGGAFLKGGAVENASTRHFYSRIAMIFPNGECYVSGRAFRYLAGLSGKSVREIIKSLPQKTWNFEP